MCVEVETDLKQKRGPSPFTMEALQIHTYIWWATAHFCFIKTNKVLPLPCGCITMNGETNGISRFACFVSFASFLWNFDGFGFCCIQVYNTSKHNLRTQICSIIFAYIKFAHNICWKHIKWVCEIVSDLSKYPINCDQICQVILGIQST